MSFLTGIDPEWRKVLAPLEPDFAKLESLLSGSNFNPEYENVMRAFRFPLSEVKVVIFGQDPYPNRSHATGLAFSVPPTVDPLPKSLANIYIELQNDIGGFIRTNGDLTSWAEQGVALVNRILTVPENESGGHRNLGWKKITNFVAQVLGERNVIPIIWGNYAQELSVYFNSSQIISSPHPSPLSAYRGFFGSKPFSKANQFLAAEKRQEIDWLRD